MSATRQPDWHDVLVATDVLIGEAPLPRGSLVKLRAEHVTILSQRGALMLLPDGAADDVPTLDLPPVEGAPLSSYLTRALLGHPVARQLWALSGRQPHRANPFGLAQNMIAAAEDFQALWRGHLLHPLPRAGLGHSAAGDVHWAYEQFIIKALGLLCQALVGGALEVEGLLVEAPAHSGAEVIGRRRWEVCQRIHWFGDRSHWGRVEYGGLIVRAAPNVVAREPHVASLIEAARLCGTAEVLPSRVAASQVCETPPIGGGDPPQRPPKKWTRALVAEALPDLAAHLRTKPEVSTREQVFGCASRYLTQSGYPAFPSKRQFLEKFWAPLKDETKPFFVAHVGHPGRPRNAVD